MLVEPINPRSKGMSTNFESQNETAVKYVTVRIVVQNSGLEWSNGWAEMKESDSAGPIS